MNKTYIGHMGADMDLEHKVPLYFVGIGGVGMASVAGLARSAGFDVRGSDQNLYPPTSEVLKELKIPVSVPYSAENILRNSDCLFVIGNSLSKQHVEVAKILELDAKYTSFPSLLGEFFLKKTSNIVVCGTHGKTTTSSLLSYALKELKTDPSYMIGGAPLDLPNPFCWGSGNLFVLEGDEYDTAFFDKGSKFLHYKPSYIVFNNLEMDHADIFKDFSMLKKTFHKLLDQVSKPEDVIANLSDPGVCELLMERGWIEKVHSSSYYAESLHHDFYSSKEVSYNPKTHLWEGEFQTQLWGKLPIITQLPGSYNFANIAQVLATLSHLVKSGKLDLPKSSEIQKILCNFHGVERRWDHRASIGGIEVYVDFAHHPTAVKNVLKNLRSVYQSHRILAAFEPKNASSRRNIFQKQYGEVLKLADQVFIAPPPKDLRIPEEERLNPEALCKAIGSHAKYFNTFDTLYGALRLELKAGDVLIFLSPGDFDGIPRTLIEDLHQKFPQ